MRDIGTSEHRLLAPPGRLPEAPDPLRALCHIPWPRFAAAAIAGGLWACSFHRPAIAGFAWLVPGLLLAATSGLERSLAFRAAYVAGAVHYLLSLSWLRFIPFPAGAFAGWFSLALFLALLPAAWALGCQRVARRLGVFPAGPFGPRELGRHLADVPWLRLNLWFVACAALWVALEMLVARLFGGFPWNLLGTSQYRMLPLVQIASVTGVYGVSFLVVWFSVSLAVALLVLGSLPDRTMAWRRPLVFPALLLVAVTGSGFLVIQRTPAPTRQLAVALVQPSIPQTVIFDPDASTNRFEVLLRLTEQALATRPDLVVWPEASLPHGLSRENLDLLVSRIRDAGAWLIFGSDDAESLVDARGRTIERAYNAAFLVGPDGRVADSYRKQRLVMFGEYIPFGRWFPFLQRLAPIGDGFHPGPGPVDFQLGSLAATASVLICFEDNFPHQARLHARPGVDFLVNITNDGWFGRSAAQWQHNANAVFRAIENGLPLVRACNNGVSCWIDPLGRLHSPRLRDGRDVYDAGFDTVTLALGSVGRTLYNRLGDVFGWTCVALALVALAPRRLRFAPAPRPAPVVDRKP